VVSGPADTTLRWGWLTL